MSESKLDGLSPDKPHKENVKISVESILGNKVSSKKVRKTAQDKKKEAFCKCITSLDNMASRQMLLMDDFGIDLSTYDDVFVSAIEDLLAYTFSPKQNSFIDFYLYERFDDMGNPLTIEDEKGNIVCLDSPEALYDYIQTLS